MRTATPLVGRDDALATLTAALADVTARGSGALAVVGQAGIGKSRLLAELAEEADAAGHLVLSGSASELERDLPFGVFVDAIDQYVDTLEPHRLARLEGGVRGELARVFPALSELRGGAAVAVQNERYRTHRAVRALLEALATKPLVLILDDFHWTDSASIELAAALLRRPPAAPVLLVLAFRPRQLPARLAVELTRAERAGTLARVELEPLSLDAAREWLGDARTLPKLFAESGGVPFYLEQLARVPDSTELVANGAPAVGNVPPLVLAALAEELSMLTELGRRVLEGAAVAGDPFELELAAVAAGLGESEVIAALDELLALDFVRSTATPRRFLHRHPLVRRAVYESSAGGWRLTAHERCAAALADRGASAEARASHVERSARQGDAGAVALLREAGEQAADRAPGTAAQWFAAALRLLPHDASAGERVELLRLRAGALAAVGRLRESHAALEAAVRLSPTADLIVACSRAERFIGLHTNANERLEAALADVDPDSREHVTLLLELAIDGFYRIAYETMHEWAERALRCAETLGDRPLIGACRSMMTLAGAWTGDIARARAAIAGATALVDALSDDELAARLDAGANLAAAELYMDMFPECARHARRVIEIGRATHQTELFPAMHAALGCALWMEGDPAGAADLLEGAVEAARLLDDDQGVAWTLFNHAAALTLVGDLDRALTCARESVELTVGHEPGLITGHAEVWMGMTLLEAGEPARAIEHLLSAGGELVELIPGGWRAVYLEALVQARVDTGDIEGARRSGEHCRAVAEHVGLPLAACMAARARARLELARGDAATAAASALASVEQAESAGALIEAARSRTLAGRAFADAGDRDRAVADLTRAAEDLGRFGARRYFQAAERELRRVGGHVSRRSAPRPKGDGLDALTRARGGDRAPDARPPHQPRDRGTAVPQREDDRDAHAQRLPQARRGVARRGRRRDRARHAHALNPIESSPRRHHGRARRGAGRDRVRSRRVPLTAARCRRRAGEDVPAKRPCGAAVCGAARLVLTRARGAPRRARRGARGGWSRRPRGDRGPTPRRRARRPARAAPPAGSRWRGVARRPRRSRRCPRRR